MDRDRVIGGIVGLCIGDAVGLPVEYRSRSYLRGDPVSDMIGFGTHNQPPGTWSSNSSLALCTAESLAQGFSVPDIATRYVTFLHEGRWTPAGVPIALAPTVQERIERLSRQEPDSPRDQEGNTQAFSVLSRTLPLAASLTGLSNEERFKRVAQVASLTNNSARTVIGCFILTEIALELAAGHPPAEAYQRTKKRVAAQLEAEPELQAYERVLGGNLPALSEDEIFSEGEVVHVVEAALWCVLNRGEFRTVVLKAVNLGGATHTTASIAGSLAGYASGLAAIPKDWIERLTLRKEILAIAERLSKRATAQQ